MEDKELYQEENIQINKQIRDSLKNSIIIPRSPTIKKVKATITNKVMAELMGEVNINKSSLAPLSDEINMKLDGVAEIIAKAIREAKPELVKEVRVANLEDARSETVKVNNLEKLEQLIQKLTDTVIEKQPIVNVQKEVTKFPNTAKDYVSVRLTNGKEFYEALMRAVGGGGGISKPSIQFAAISQSGAGTDILVAAMSGKRIKVVGYVVVMGSAGTVTFKTASTAITGSMSFASNGGVSSAGTEHFPVFQTNQGEDLSITTTGAAAQGHLSYILE